MEIPNQIFSDLLKLKKGKLRIPIIAQCSFGAQSNLLMYDSLIKCPPSILVSSVFIDVQFAPKFPKTILENPCGKPVGKF